MKINYRLAMRTLSFFQYFDDELHNDVFCPFYATGLSLHLLKTSENF